MEKRKKSQALAYLKEKQVSDVKDELLIMKMSHLLSIPRIRLGILAGTDIVIFFLTQYITNVIKGSLADVRNAIGGNPTFSFANISFSSRDLLRNMEGCTEICVLACTLGIQADRLIHKTELLSIHEAAILQACAAAMVEDYCNTINRDIQSEAEQRGMYCRPRYSPGYGDVPLALQKDIFQLLNLPKNLGMSLSESLLMIPTKSITAFIGLSPAAHKITQAQCDSCNMQDTCLYQRKDQDENIT